MEIILKNIPDLPPEAAGFEVVENFTVPEIGDYGLSTPTVWRRVEDDRWGLAIVARKPEPRGLAFIEALPANAALIHDGTLYVRGLLSFWRFSAGGYLLMAACSSRVWHWQTDTHLPTITADNCRIIWPEGRTNE